MLEKQREHVRKTKLLKNGPVSFDYKTQPDGYKTQLTGYNR
jgi:hypothetical protein